MTDSAIEAADKMPPPVKVQRTYGRKKDAAAAMPDAVPTTLSKFSPKRRNIDDDDILGPEEARERAGSPAIQDFGWRARLKELDDQFMDDDDDVVGKSVVPTTKSVPIEHDTADDSFTTANSSIFDAPPLLTSTPPTPGSSPMPQNPKRKATRVSNFMSDEENDARSPASPGFNVLTGNGKRKRLASTSLSGSEEENSTMPVMKLTRASESPIVKVPDMREPGPSNLSRRRASNSSEKPGKIKKPTKKEELESKKAHARLMAEQKASVRKISQPLPMEGFLEMLEKDAKLLKPKSQGLRRQPSSDPIQQFSSPARNLPTQRQPHSRSLSSQPSFPKVVQDSDEELLEVKDILKQGKVHKSEVERRQSLAAMKERAIRENARRLAERNQSDEDDDLEIETVQESSMFKGKHKALENKVRELHGGRPNRKSLPADLGETQVLRAAALPHFSERTTQSSSLVNHQNFVAIMRNKGMKQSEHITKEKEAVWVEKGGKVRPRKSAPASTNPLLVIAEKVRKMREVVTDAEPEGDSEADNGSDEDFHPQVNGPASESFLSEDEKENMPIPRSEIVELEYNLDEEENDENIPPNDENDENIPPKQRVSRPTVWQARRTVLSDDEGEASSSLPTGILVPDTSLVLDTPSILNHALARRGSTSSFENATTIFDENEDKENDRNLMFDQGEDKENSAVPRLHSPRNMILGSSQNQNIFDLSRGTHRRSSLSPSNPGPSSASKLARQPLQQRRLEDEMDEEFPPLTGTVAGSDSPVRYQAPSASASPKPLQPAFGAGLGGLTQLFDDDDGAADENMPPPRIASLKPAFSLNRSLSGSAPRPLQFGGPLSFGTASQTKERTFGGMRPFGAEQDEFSLTLDTKLQPALDVDSQVLRKADAIFEKEQNFVLEEAVTKAQAKPVLYITENGFLTQTRPDVSTPVVYRSVSATQNSVAPPGSAGTLPPSSSQRLPLSTLSFTEETDSPTQPSRLSRLRKGPRPLDASPREDGISGSGSNAFALMLEAQARQQRRRENAKKLKTSAFVEGEAQESDEDEEFGFGKAKGSKSDEEDSDEDEDGVIENLVDDEKKEDEREDLVLEKVKEQQEIDDQALEKYHMNAIEGKYRGKRRGGRVGLNSDSESEDEDDEARRLRQRIHKKRRVTGDTLEELGKDEKSGAFVRGYEDDLNDDAVNDFAHLAQDEMDVDENEENEEPGETVDAAELQAQLRLAAQSKKGKERHVQQRFDPENVDWATNWSDDDESCGVKDIEMPRKSAVVSRRAGHFQDGEMGLFSKQGDWDAAQLESWRKEQSGRNFGTGSARGAITGHGKKSASTKGSRAGTAVAGQGKRGLAKAASALAIVSSKQSRFESNY